MSFRSDHSDAPGCHAAEATEPDDRRLDPIDASTGGRSPRGVADDARSVSGTRTRVVSLRAEVELLEAERETLANQVLALEADVAELEAEVDALERTIECETQRRQRVIDRYEHVIAEKEAAYRDVEEESGAATGGTDARRIRPVSRIRSSVETVWSRVRHLVPNG